MEKRLFNKLGFETSLLGLGCMRFPQKNGKIDLLETEKLVDACMAGGINYFDTAYVYGDGDSENASILQTNSPCGSFRRGTHRKSS